MSKKKTIQTDEDLLKLKMPTIEPDGKMATKSSTLVKPTEQTDSYFQEHPIVMYSIITIILVLLTVSVFIVRKLTKNRNPMREYTKQQTKNLKKNQAYVSSTNKLETPDNITDCIRAFIERTK